jgi:hypothetical protein
LGCADSLLPRAPLSPCLSRASLNAPYSPGQYLVRVILLALHGLRLDLQQGRGRNLVGPKPALRSRLSGERGRIAKQPGHGRQELFGRAVPRYGGLARGGRGVNGQRVGQVAIVLEVEQQGRPRRRGWPLLGRVVLGRDVQGEAVALVPGEARRVGGRGPEDAGGLPVRRGRGERGRGGRSGQGGERRGQAGEGGPAGGLCDAIVCVGTL